MPPPPPPPNETIRQRVNRVGDWILSSIFGYLSTAWQWRVSAKELVRSFATWFSDFTTWLLAVSENLLTIFIAYCVVKATWYLMLKDGPSIETAVTRIENHWKGALILIVPLFFRTVREVLSKVKKLPLGMETESDTTPDETKPNPPDAAGGT